MLIKKKEEAHVVRVDLNSVVMNGDEKNILHTLWSVLEFILGWFLVEYTDEGKT